MALNIVVFTSRGLGCSLPLLRFVLSLYLFIFVYCSITIIAVFCYYVVNKEFNSMMSDHTSAIRYVIVYRYRIMLLKCVQLISPMFCSFSTSLILVPDKYSMWNQRRLCTNVKLSSACSQSVTLSTYRK